MTNDSHATEAKQQGLRELAYSLWEADGSPHGQHEEYWRRAVAHMGATGAVAVEDDVTLPGSDEMKSGPSKVATKSAGTRKGTGKSSAKLPATRNGAGTDKSHRRQS